MRNKFKFSPVLSKGDNSVRILHFVFDVSPSTSPFHKYSVRKIKQVLAEIKSTAKKEGFDVYVAITEYATNTYPILDFCLLNTLEINKIPFSKDVKSECTNTGEALLYAKKKTMNFYKDMKSSSMKLIRTPMLFLVSDGEVYPRSPEVLSKYTQAANEIKALEHPGNMLDELVTVIGAMVDLDELNEFYQLTHYKDRIVHLDTKNITPFLEIMKYYTCTKTNSAALYHTKMVQNIQNFV